MPSALPPFWVSQALSSLPYILTLFLFRLPSPEASSPTSTLVFMLFGVGIVLPIIIVYNVYVAHVFTRDGPKVVDKLGKAFVAKG